MPPDADGEIEFDKDDFDLLMMALRQSHDCLQVAAWLKAHNDNNLLTFPVDTADGLDPLERAPLDKPLDLGALKKLVPASFFPIVDCEDFATKAYAILRLAHVVPDLLPRAPKVRFH